MTPVLALAEVCSNLLAMARLLQPWMTEAFHGQQVAAHLLQPWQATHSALERSWGATSPFPHSALHPPPPFLF